MGQQDPYIRVRVGEFSEKTYTQDNGGGDVIFDFLDFKAVVTREILEKGKIEFEAWDENSNLDLRGDVLIGSGFALLDKIKNYGENIEMEIPIKDKKGKLSGKILAFLRLEEKSINEKDNVIIPINTEFTSGTLYIKRIVSFNLVNTEILSILGEKKDPFVCLSIKNDGLDWDGMTPILNNTNNSSVWDFLDFQFDITRDQLINGILNLTVKDKNNFKNDSIIGIGSLELKKINNLDKLLELSVDLKVKDKKGNFIEKSRGKLVCYVELKLKKEKEYFIKEGFKFGKLQISRIQTFNLKNTEIFGASQDPYCVLKIGEIWTEKTSTKNSAGSDVLWDFLTLNCDINRDQVINNLLEVSVFDENSTRKDSIIGKGETSLMICGSDINNEKELNIPILDSKGKPSGRVNVFIKITDFENEDNIIIPETFVDGSLKIKRITLSNTSINNQFHISKIEPYVIIKLNKFNERTTKCTDDEDINNITWKNLNYTINCDNKCVQTSELIVEVWSHSSLNLTSDTLISSSKIPIRKSGGHIGKEIEITRDLNIPGKEGKYAGKVTVLCQLNPNEILLKEPDLGTNYSIFYFILFYFVNLFHLVVFSLFFSLNFYFRYIFTM